MVARGPKFPRKMIMSSDGTQAPANPGIPNLQVAAQYIKDLSFENPGATANIADRPQIELAVDLNAAATGRKGHVRGRAENPRRRQE